MQASEVKVMKLVKTKLEALISYNLAVRRIGGPYPLGFRGCLEPDQSPLFSLSNQLKAGDRREESM